MTENKRGEQGRGARQWIVLTAMAIFAILALTACGTDSGASTLPTALPTTAPAASDVRTQPTATTDAGMPATEMSATTAAPAGGSASATAAPARSSSATSQVQATLIEWAIQLSQNTVPAGDVKFAVTNAGHMPHNFTVADDSGVVGHTSTFMPSESPQTLELTLKPGTYTIICSLPGHAARGQMTNLTVK